MIPNLLRKLPVPQNIPQELKLQIQELNKQENKEAFLRSCFEFVAARNSGERINLFLKFSRLFRNNIKDILDTQGYAHCTTMNYLLRIMLIKSGRFKESDIKLKLTNTWFIGPHQYLKVRVSHNKTIDVDPWAKQFGIPFGKHAQGFSAGTVFRVKK